MMYPKPECVHKKRITISLAQQTRLYARAGGRCESCKCNADFRGLSIHHLTLKGMGGTKEEYEDDELEVVCGKCSDLFHGIVDK